MTIFTSKEDNRSNNTAQINLKAWTFTVENRCFCALSNGDWLYRTKKPPIKDAEYSSFMKPSVGSSIEAVDRASKPDGIHLKVRQFFKKLSRKTYRGCLDNKSTCSSLSGREEKKNSEKLQAKKDSNLSINLMKPASAKHYKSSTEDSSPPLSSNQSCSESQSHFSAVDSDEKNDDLKEKRYGEGKKRREHQTSRRKKGEEMSRVVSRETCTEPDGTKTAYEQ
ncbi:hypothetical protein K1719_003964 [Acacia pycnantha]|nr:hypothetical protein K1719_003964 [Acacia pycnantha]